MQRYRTRRAEERAELAELRARVKFLERSLAELGYIEDWHEPEGTPYWRKPRPDEFIIDGPPANFSDAEIKQILDDEARANRPFLQMFPEANPDDY